MNREVLRLAIPNILSNVSIPLLGMVDTALMGRLETEIYIGAVALGSILFNFIYWGFGFLRMGTTGFTAQAFGKDDHTESAAILGRGLLVAISGSIILIALQAAIAWAAFSLLQGDPAIESLARQYFNIRIYAAPATLGLFVFHGWFLGMQNARYPMYLTIVVNGLNILFNILFVFHMGMKSNGVALGTVCAQYIGLILALGIFLLKYRRFISLLDRARILKLAAMKRFFAINADIFIRTICLVFTFAFFTSASAAIDSMVLAANQILMLYFSLMAYAVDGFAFAAESLVGRFFGAKDLSKLKQSIRLLFFWGTGLGVFFALCYGLLGKPLLRVFTDQMDIIQTAMPYVFWVVVVTIAGSIAFLWDGVYIGATASVPMRNMMLLSTLGVFLPTYYLTITPLGNHGLWLALTLFMIARALTLGLLAKHNIFTLSKH